MLPKNLEYQMASVNVELSVSKVPRFGQIGRILPGIVLHDLGKKMVMYTIYVMSLYV